MSNQLVTIATFNFTTEPNFLLFKAALEHHDISYFAAEENTINANPFLSISIGGIRVQVHEEDVPEATSIWREISEADAEAIDNEDFGTHDSILDDMRGTNIWSEDQQSTVNYSAYFIIVVILITLLIISLFFITFISL
ncbi:MAG: hypothetical protein ACK4TA_26350 [Saprospiraceae bacterium]